MTDSELQAMIHSAYFTWAIGALKALVYSGCAIALTVSICKWLNRHKLNHTVYRFSPPERQTDKPIS